jgi:succinyl-CoA synthetase beta subunit
VKIHEYQAKELLKSYNVPIPRGRVATTADEAHAIAAEFGGTVVVKAQVHAGGRGKAGGIKVAKTADECRAVAEKMIGLRLVTHQTGPGGVEVRKVLIEEGMEIDRELYVGIVLDRSASKLVVMASEAGGMDIEQVAAQTPERIIKEVADPAVGLQPFQARKLAFRLNLDPKLVGRASQFILALYKAYEGCDASLAEINPLIVTRSSDLLALDAKINIDDNALSRHPDIAALRDVTEEAPLEVEASKYHLNYIKLDGNIGCMVNGAGLAMATMDIIKLAGGSPANFLDVGGGASVETVGNGFRILLSDPSVKAVLINIFGGIVRCDRVAEGVVEALSNLDVKIPVVVRLEGTNADIAAKILDESPLDFIVAKDLKDAAEKVVSAAGITEGGRL